MKKHTLAVLLIILPVLFSCNSPEQNSDAHYSPLLASLDTLMSYRPDSALSCLLSLSGTTRIENLSPVDRHHYQLLLSEANYRTGNEQTNRTELLHALAFFDSLFSAPNPDNNCILFAVRANNMVAACYYGEDSVVEACRYYLHGLEIMESGFTETERLTRYARFMALMYSRMTELFSNLDLHEQAIRYGKCSMIYLNEFHARPQHRVWILTTVGDHYDALMQTDSALAYYCQAIRTTADTSCLTYRDVVNHRTNLLYFKDKKAQPALKTLFRLLSLSESPLERSVRCLSIGEIYLGERRLDSAEAYLRKVYL